MRNVILKGTSVHEDSKYIIIIYLLNSVDNNIKPIAMMIYNNLFTSNLKR